jgi:hypothetical protein
MPDLGLDAEAGVTKNYLNSKNKVLYHITSELS